MCWGGRAGWMSLWGHRWGTTGLRGLAWRGHAAPRAQTHGTKISPDSVSPCVTGCEGQRFNQRRSEGEAPPSALPGPKAAPSQPAPRCMPHPGHTPPARPPGSACQLSVSEECEGPGGAKRRGLHGHPADGGVLPLHQPEGHHEVKAWGPGETRGQAGGRRREKSRCQVQGRGAKSIPTAKSSAPRWGVPTFLLLPSGLPRRCPAPPTATGPSRVPPPTSQPGEAPATPPLLSAPSGGTLTPLGAQSLGGSTGVTGPPAPLPATGGPAASGLSGSLAAHSRETPEPR